MDNREHDVRPDLAHADTGGSIPADTFAARLVLARHFAGRLSIEQAARRCGLNAGNWAHWEDGRKPRDKVEVAGAIAAGLDVNFNWLLLGGPLAGPRGMPVESRRRSDERPDGLNMRYPQRPDRPRVTRPNGRPSEGQRPGAPPRPEQRRPVRISRPSAA